MSGQWRVVCEDGVHIVIVTRHDNGQWNAAMETSGLVVSRSDEKSARAAVTHLASSMSWGVVKVFAPGAVSTDYDQSDLITVDASEHSKRRMMW